MSHGNVYARLGRRTVSSTGTSCASPEHRISFDWASLCGLQGLPEGDWVVQSVKRTF